MELFLLRHGDAVVQAPRDFERVLSDQGRAELSSVMSQAGPALASLEQVLVSPYVRTQQSFEHISQALPAAVTKTDCDLLVPGSNPYETLNFVCSKAKQQGVASLMLVTHQPLIGALLNLFCDLEPGAHYMGTASLAAMDMDEPAAALGDLRWVKHPQPD